MAPKSESNDDDDEDAKRRKGDFVEEFNLSSPPDEFLFKSQGVLSSLCKTLCIFKDPPAGEGGCGHILPSGAGNVYFQPRALALG